MGGGWRDIDMDKVNEIVRLSASDLVNHLACRHLTELNHEVAVGLRVAPNIGTLHWTCCGRGVWHTNRPTFSI